MPIRVACLTLLAACLAVSTAHAGTPGKWTQLGQANLDNIDETALVRTADGTLHAIWTIPSHNNGGNGDDLVHDSIAANGVPAAAPNPITTGWGALTAVPDLVPTPDGGMRAFFGGIRTTDPNEPNSNMNTATAPASGAAWNLFAGTTVKDDSAYASDAGAAVLQDGTPILSFGSTTQGTFVHRGLDPGTPDFNVQAELGGCCGYSPDIAVDTQTGVPVVAWYSNATNKIGVFVQTLDPATGQPTGTPTQMPGSVTNFNGTPSSDQQLTRTPIVARVGGGVFVAYGGGYPTTTKVLLWRVGRPTSTPVFQGPNDHIVNLAAAPDGRIWVFWIDRSGAPRVFATRSNKAVTAFGPVVPVGAPTGQDQAWRLAGNAQTGALDIVAAFSKSNAIANFYTQVLPGLDLHASPLKIKGSKTTAVKFTVTDPDPVKGATVTAAGHSGKTNAKGRVTLDLGPTSKHAIVAKATKSGYVGDTVKVKVTH